MGVWLVKAVHSPGDDVLLAARVNGGHMEPGGTGRYHLRPVAVLVSIILEAETRPHGQGGCLNGLITHIIIDYYDVNFCPAVD